MMSQQQTLQFDSNERGTIATEPVEPRDRPRPSSVARAPLPRREPDRPPPRSAPTARESLQTVSQYGNLLPTELDYSTPQRYGETLDQYTDRLFDTASTFIPGGFDRDNAPTYREVFGSTQIYTGWQSLPTFLRPPLPRPPAPAGNVPPGNPGYCLARNNANPSHVEVMFSVAHYSYSEESYDRYSEGGEYLGYEVVNTSQSAFSGTAVIRVFFATSFNLHLFNRQRDSFTYGTESFECPQICLDTGLTGGCFEVRSIDDPPFDPALGYAGYSKTHELLLNLGGSCYKIFSFQEFGLSLVTRPGNGSHVVYGYSRASINYRLIYNPLGDYPFGSEPTPPPTPPKPMADQNCCDCRKIAAMLAVQTVAQTGINGAIAIAQVKAIAAMLALFKGLSPTINIRSPQFSLFDRLIGLDGIMQSIRDAITGVRDGGRDGEDTDLTEVIRRLDELKSEVLKVKKDAKRSYNVLGGDAWFNSADSLSPELEFNPESVIRSSRDTVYPQDDGECREIQARSLLGLLGAFSAVEHHRSGAYRLPAKLPKSMVDEDNEEQMTIPDSATLMQWLIVQLDAIMGQYPLKIKFKDANGNQQDLKVQNQAEILAEIMGLLLGIATDVDVAVELGMKSTVESIKGANAAILASDYAKANAEFLGYRGKETGRDIPLTITPGARNMKDALKESKQKGSGWKFDDKEDFQDLIRRLLVGVEIVKAAHFRNLDNEDIPIPGERIKRERDKQNEVEDNQWSEFIANTENPPARLRRDQNAPQPDLKDVSVDKQV